MQRTLPRTLWMVLLALVAGAALRLWFIHSYPEVQGDPLIYGSIAKNWMLHGVYGTTSSGSLQPTLIRLPGYPLFLMLCFRLFGMEHYHAVMYAQTAIDLGTCLLIAAFTGRIWSKRAAWWALWLAVLCPFTANYAATPLTETLELFSIAFSIYALVRFLEQPGKLWAVLSALGWGYAALLRPDGALLAVTLFPAMIWYGRKRWGTARMLRYAVAAGAVSILPFMPWAIRNWRTFHVIQPLAPRYATDPGEDTNPGFQRWTKTVCADMTCTWEVYWNIDSDVVDAKSLPSRAFDNAAERNKTEQLLADYNQTTSLTPALDDRFGQLAEQRIARNPLRYYVSLPLTRVADMWLRPRTELLWIELRWWQYNKHHAETRFAIVYVALNLLYLVLGLLGLRKHPPLAAAFVLFILLRCLLLATIEAPEPRYTLECFPMIIALGAIAVSGPRSSALQTKHSPQRREGRKEKPPGPFADLGGFPLRPSR